MAGDRVVSLSSSGGEGRGEEALSCRSDALSATARREGDLSGAIHRHDRGLRRFLVLLSVLLCCSLHAAIVEIKLPPETASFKPGLGVEFANGQCLVCHSVEYVTTQPPFPRTFWSAEVKKMQQTYGAQVPADQVEPIVDYLTLNYGVATNGVSPAVVRTETKLARPTTPEGIAGMYGCLACHRVDSKVVGPAYKDVAAKYSQDPNGAAKIIEQIRTGGSGKWGSAIMPPFSVVSDADAKALAAWILSRK